MFNTRRIFAAACIGMLLFGMTMLSLGTVNTFLAERFALDETGVGSLAALLPFGILLGSLFFGPVVDRFGYKLPLAGAAVLLSWGFVTVAEAESFPVVQSAFFVIGLGGGILNGGTNALVADISGNERGARLSLLGVFFGIGALGMPALTGILLHRAAPSEIFTGFSLAILLPVLFILTTRFPQPKHRQGFPLAQAMSIIRERALLLLGFALFFESALESLANNWTPTFLLRVSQVDADGALFMLTILSASLTGARLVLGWALRHIRPPVILFTCLGFTAFGILLLFFTESILTAGAAMILLGFGFSAAFPLLFSYVAELFPDLTGTAIGILLVIALTGNMLLNYAMGMLSQAWGIELFPAFLLACLVGFSITLSGGLRAVSHRLVLKRN